MMVNSSSQGCIEKACKIVVIYYYQIVNVLIRENSSDQPLTKVPTFSPVTTRRRLPPLFMSNTMMGRLFSIQSVKAVMSTTFRFCEIQSWKVITLYLVA